MDQLSEEKIKQQSSYINVTNNITNNCKLSIVYPMGTFSNPLILVEDKIKIFNLVLTKCVQLVYINTNDENVANFFKENYELYGYNEIPIGYNNKLQYHIFIKNNINFKEGNLCFKPPIKTVIEINPYKDNYKVNIKNPMIEIIDNRKTTNKREIKKRN